MLNDYDLKWLAEQRQEEWEQLIRNRVIQAEVAKSTSSPRWYQRLTRSVSHKEKGCDIPSPPITSRC